MGGGSHPLPPALVFSQSVAMYQIYLMFHLKAILSFKQYQGQSKQGFLPIPSLQ